MGRLGDAIEAANVKRGPLCHVLLLLERMDDDDAADLVEYLKGRVAATVIQTELAKLGHDIGVTPLLRHRHTLRGEPGGCACPV